MVLALSPRVRRLESDLASLENLRNESSSFDFEALQGTPPHHYMLTFNGPSLAQKQTLFGSRVSLVQTHQIELQLVPSYPRSNPMLIWKTPIFHPNIASNGAVCLGGFSSHWVPGLMLDQLCEMLWDMMRYANVNPTSPYNREAALWLASQKSFRFPLDPRPLRDRVVRPSFPPNSEKGIMRIDHPNTPSRSLPHTTSDITKSSNTNQLTTSSPEVLFLD